LFSLSPFPAVCFTIAVFPTSLFHGLPPGILKYAGFAAFYFKVRSKSNAFFSLHGVIFFFGASRRRCLSTDFPFFSQYPFSFPTGSVIHRSSDTSVLFAVELF